jgi:hypothetical protein
MSGNTSATGGFIAPLPSPAALDDNALTDLLQAAVTGISGLDSNFVRPRWQPNPGIQPSAADTWTSIGIEETDAPGFPWEQEADDGNSEFWANTETMRLFCVFYGPSALSAARRTRDGFYIGQNLDTLRFAGLGLIEVTRILAVPELINSQWIERYDLTVRLRRFLIRGYPIFSVVRATATINGDGTSTTPVDTGPDIAIYTQGGEISSTQGGEIGISQ